MWRLSCSHHDQQSVQLFPLPLPLSSAASAIDPILDGSACPAAAAAQGSDTEGGVAADTPNCLTPALEGVEFNGSLSSPGHSAPAYAGDKDEKSAGEAASGPPARPPARGRIVGVPGSYPAAFSALSRSQKTANVTVQKSQARPLPPRAPDGVSPANNT
ncbi:uncharacterized protein ColSpa_04411 [Colletotrichum spaethianum]|uniref:Uncharacterized protein n=1 Tax=Colletotrichum spaethianum TaxID=700344 RepID=A0AA37LDY0_9PEZI|nr:uncharacterized protein ColSpa_04411 [Colletotrichum spaethianum]GKT44230.1 hypothetical protein ColSpa_04411 [Colletotrichum spaethianum]